MYETIITNCIRLNGQPRQIAEGTTIAALLAELELKSAQVAVELNMELAPRAEHATRRLSDGDRVEIVTLVGGG
jgi:sulfur carrier protein